MSKKQFENEKFCINMTMPDYTQASEQGKQSLFLGGQQCNILHTPLT